MSLKPLANAGLAQLDLISGHTAPQEPEHKVKSPRSANRAAGWESSLAQWYSYMTSQTTTEAAQKHLDDLYEQALEEGPDFLRYRTGSKFREAPKLSIDRNTRARILWQLRMLTKACYETREKGKHGLARSVRPVLEALLGLAVKYGAVRPSLEGLARMACVSKQTVINALDALQLWGFVVVHRRIRRVRTPLGFKVVQDTNAYAVRELCSWARAALDGVRGFSESRKCAASKHESKIYISTTKEWPHNCLPDGVFEPPNPLYARS